MTLHLISHNGGRHVDAAQHEAPQRPPIRVRQFRASYDIDPPPAAAPWYRRVPWFLLASLSLNVGLLAALAVIGGHF